MYPSYVLISEEAVSFRWNEGRSDVPEIEVGYSWQGHIELEFSSQKARGADAVIWTFEQLVVARECFNWAVDNRGDIERLCKEDKPDVAFAKWSAHMTDNCEFEMPEYVHAETWPMGGEWRWTR